MVVIVVCINKSGRAGTFIAKMTSSPEADLTIANFHTGRERGGATGSRGEWGERKEDKKGAEEGIREKGALGRKRKVVKWVE